MSFQSSTAPARRARQPDAPSWLPDSMEQPSDCMYLADSRPKAPAIRRAGQPSCNGSIEDVQPYGEFIYMDGRPDTVSIVKKKEKDSEEAEKERLAFEEAAGDVADLLIGIKLIKLSVLNSLPSDHPLITRMLKLARLFDDFLPTNTEYLENQELVNRLVFYLSGSLENAMDRGLVLRLFEEVSKEISKLPDFVAPRDEPREERKIRVVKIPRVRVPSAPSGRKLRAQKHVSEEISMDITKEPESNEDSMEVDHPVVKQTIGRKMTGYTCFMHANRINSSKASHMWKAMSEVEKNVWKVKNAMEKGKMLDEEH